MLLHIHGFNSSPDSNTFHMLREIFPQAHALAYACHGLFRDNLADLHGQAVSLLTSRLAGQEEQAGQREQAGQGAECRTTCAVKNGPELGPVLGPEQAPEQGHAAKHGHRWRVPLVISGSSLGGFYASQLAALLYAAYPHLPCHCALFNPVVYPATALRPFLGRNTLMHSGVQWDFTPAMLESYAHFSDTRAGTSASPRAEIQAGTEAAAQGSTGLEGATADSPARPALRRFVLLGRNDSLLNPEEARAYWQQHAHIHDTDDEHSITTLDAATVAALRDMGAGA